MKKTWIFGSLTALVLCSTACDPKEDAPEGQDGATSGESSTGEEPIDASETDPDPDPDPDPETDDGSTGEPEIPTDTDCSFIGCDMPDGPTPECSLWAQDCGTEEKCMPWDNQGGNSWNASRCSPLSATPGQPGDPCMVEGSGVSGVDDCDVASMCWGVDPETNMGVCVALCQGSENAPLCDDPETTCIIANEGFLPLCLPNCDPLLQNCIEGEACYPGDGGFVCVPDASGPDLGAYGDACAYTNACDPSLLCVGAGAVPGCDSAQCCTHFCDLADPEPSAECGGVSQGQECLSFFPEGMVIPGYEDVGFCALPE